MAPSSYMYTNNGSNNNVPKKTYEYGVSNVTTTTTKEWSFHDAWVGFTDWIVHFFRGVNDETLAHPYYISLALLVVVAWPHLLMLPVWFGKDAYHRVDEHTRETAQRVLAAAPMRPQRRRDRFISKYRSFISGNSVPEPEPRTPLFGGTPLSDGVFDIEEERSLPVALRVVRWGALGWAVYILGREVYFFVVRYA